MLLGDMLLVDVMMRGDVEPRYALAVFDVETSARQILAIAAPYMSSAILNKKKFFVLNHAHSSRITVRLW
jgi:hypothetical protein